MSFNGDVKNELARLEEKNHCCKIAELVGFIGVSWRFMERDEDMSTDLNLDLSSELPSIVRRMNGLIKDVFGVQTRLEVQPAPPFRKGRTYVARIDKVDDALKVFKDMHLSDEVNYNRWIDEILATKCCRKACIRGAFLGGGIVTNPIRANHFEISCKTEKFMVILKRTLNSFYDIHGKNMVRRGEQVIYIKNSNQILDMLAIMGAHSQYFEYENVRLKKELRNEANRLSNCDQANIDKILKASSRQIRNINEVGLDSLPEKLREVAVVRLEHPEAGLEDIGRCLDPPLKKSGVNSRFARIEQMALMMRGRKK